MNWNPSSISEIETSAMQYRNDYIEHGETHINGSCGFYQYSNYDEWMDRVTLAHDKDTSFIHVPATTYFTVRESDNKIVGSIQLRHELSDELRKHGGHIGYGICPSERSKGYGTLQYRNITARMCLK